MFKQMMNELKSMFISYDQHQQIAIQERLKEINKIKSSGIKTTLRPGVNQPKFCIHCGMRNLEVLNRVHYDENTGEQTYITDLVCPSGINKRL